MENHWVLPYVFLPLRIDVAYGSLLRLILSDERERENLEWERGERGGDMALGPNFEKCWKIYVCGHRGRFVANLHTRRLHWTLDIIHWTPSGSEKSKYLNSDELYQCWGWGMREGGGVCGGWAVVRRWTKRIRRKM